MKFTLINLNTGKRITVTLKKNLPASMLRAFHTGKNVSHLIIETLPAGWESARVHFAPADLLPN